MPRHLERTRARRPLAAEMFTATPKRPAVGQSTFPRARQFKLGGVTSAPVSFDSCHRARAVLKLACERVGSLIVASRSAAQLDKKCSGNCRKYSIDLGRLETTLYG